LILRSLAFCWICVRPFQLPQPLQLAQPLRPVLLRTRRVHRHLQVSCCEGTLFWGPDVCAYLGSDRVRVSCERTCQDGVVILCEQEACGERGLRVDQSSGSLQGRSSRTCSRRHAFLHAVWSTPAPSTWCEPSVHMRLWSRCCWPNAVSPGPEAIRPRLA
jgi:hypothetical protein